MNKWMDQGTKTWKQIGRHANVSGMKFVL
jgi:hypothetical protein